MAKWRIDYYVADRVFTVGDYKDRATALREASKDALPFNYDMLNSLSVYQVAEDDKIEGPHVDTTHVLTHEEVATFLAELASIMEKD
jgi:hypothetical protein